MLIPICYLQVRLGGETQEKGIRYELKVCDREDLNRQVIKSDTASIIIKELDFEMPASAQPGF